MLAHLHGASVRKLTVEIALQQFVFEVAVAALTLSLVTWPSLAVLREAAQLNL